MNLGRLRQRIYSPPPLTTRALPREPWNPSPKPRCFQPRPRLRDAAREAGRRWGTRYGRYALAGTVHAPPRRSAEEVRKGGSRGRQGDDGPGLKKCDARPGEAARHGGLACHHGGRSREGTRRGACDDMRILSDIRTRATALRIKRPHSGCTDCPALRGSPAGAGRRRRRPHTPPAGRRHPGTPAGGASLARIERPTGSVVP